MHDLVAIAFGYAKRIRNGRTLMDIHGHADKELNVELKDEIVAKEQGLPQGEDGINGEAIDVIACMLDILVKANPTMSVEDLSAMTARILDEKCRKWEKHYSNSIHRDRSAG